MKQRCNLNRHPKCSVVIPTHNCLNYLKQSLESVRQQTLINLEIIVVDDNSSDGSWRWLQQQMEKEPRLRAFRVKVQSPARARNFAVKQARGEWIAFLDADDFWQPQKLTHQLNYHLEHPEIDFSFTDYRHFDMSGKDLGTCFEFWPGHRKWCVQRKGFRELRRSRSKLFAQNIVGTSTVMVRRSRFIRVGGFDERLSSAEDWDLWLKLARNGRVGIGNYCDTHYLMRPDSESSKKESRIRAMQLIFERYRPHVSLGAMRIAQSRIWVAEAEKWLSLKQPARAMLAHGCALLLTPSLRRLKELVMDLRLWLSHQTATQE